MVLGDASQQLGPSLFILGRFFFLGVGRACQILRPHKEIRSGLKLKKEIRRKFIIRIHFLFIIGNKKQYVISKDHVFLFLLGFESTILGNIASNLLKVLKKTKKTKIGRVLEQDPNLTHPKPFGSCRVRQGPCLTLIKNNYHGMNAIN